MPVSSLPTGQVFKGVLRVAQKAGGFLLIPRHYAPHQEVCFSSDFLERKRESSEPVFLASLARRCIIIGSELIKLIHSPFSP
jgi:hypothetical protein